MLSRLKFGLSDTLSLLQNTVEQFAQHEIAPLAAKIDEDNEFPRQLWPKLGQLGLLGMTISEEYGGVGMNYSAQVIAMEEISRASASVGLSYGAHTNLCTNQIAINGNPEQKKRYLPLLVSGEHVGALAISEAGSGSDVMSMSLTAEEKSDHFSLNGNKM